jgi:leader peptidase (prepilin peptidase)/N-methyltransferase
MRVAITTCVFDTVYSPFLMIRVLGTAFAALMGLAFGSFLNVCLTRWPAGESIVKPRSHCRNCGRTLAWWENVPLVSWLALRGRCRTCGSWIGWRYVIVEFVVGVSWALETWQSFHPEILSAPNLIIDGFWFIFLHGLSQMLFIWMLVGLAVLDAEHFWLPDRLTWTGIVTGALARALFVVPLMGIDDSTYGELPEFDPLNALGGIWIFLSPLLAALLAAALIILIRWIYKLIRHREGLGLGDAKLMAMLAAWLGLPGALLSFAIGVCLGSLVAIVLLVRRTKSETGESWAGTKLPLGTFLCIGGIVSSLWGQPIIATYLHWAGF